MEALRPTTNVIERAFEIARTGDCRTVEEIAAALEREGLHAVDSHLRGKMIRRELRAAMRTTPTTKA